MKKILVTGGNGFIARNIFEELKNSYDIKLANSKELDLLDEKKVMEVLRKEKFEIVLHCANYDAAPKHSFKDKTKVLENNTRMFFNIERCKDNFGKMIYFGTGAEFDREHWIANMKEDYFDKHIPKDQYGLSKYIMTKYTMASDKIYNLRLFAVFGEYEDERVRLISNLCHNAVQDKALNIIQNKKYDFMDVKDLNKIVKYFIENTPKNKIYNVCTGKTIEFKTIAEKIINISGKNLDLLIEKQGFGTEYSGDNSLLLKEIGGFEFTKIDDSIKRLYNWYNKK